MKLTKKLFISILLTGLISLSVLNATAFSGYAGIKGDLKQNEDSGSCDPIMNIQAYFAGQLDFNPAFLLRTELSLQTADVIKNGLFEETDSKFCIDELSCTYIKPFLGITQYFSLFLGNYEPIGSDVFLQRQFGTKPITSMLTESWLGVKGSSVYPFYGFGGSYIVHMNNSPIATGIYIYKNKNNDQDINQLNIDWRFGSVTQYCSVDFAAGVGAPLDSKNGSEDVILLVDKLYLHTGIDFLVGNRYTQSLFIQAGFDNMPLKAGDNSNEIDSDDIYLILEPRLYTKKFKAHATFFSVPEENTEKLIFIEKGHTLGANLTIFTDQLYVKNKDITFGFHSTLSFPDKDFYDLKRFKELKDDDYAIKVSPFVKIPLMAGNLNFLLQCKMNGFDKNQWYDQFKCNIGYKAQL